MDMNRFHAAVDTLVALNHEARARFVECKENFSREQWAETFCTVTCYIGRMTGNSEYIKRRAGPGDLIVTINTKVGADMFKGASCETVSARQLEWRPRGRDFETIYVDEPAYVFGIFDRKRFFNLLATGSERQTFVMLGSVQR